jgi:hypothetical protein
MKFFRILPEMCANTTCLFSNSTLNIALGSGSSTTAVTSIASSLDIRHRDPIQPKTQTDKYKGNASSNQMDKQTESVLPRLIRVDPEFSFHEDRGNRRNDA